MSLPPVRTRIKICGLTREQDVDAAVAAGADAIGFVLYARSPRFVTPERAALDKMIQDQATSTAWRSIKGVLSERDQLLWKRFADFPADAKGEMIGLLEDARTQTEEQLGNLRDDMNAEGADKQAKKLETRLENIDAAMKDVEDIFGKATKLIDAGYVPLSRFGQYRVNVTDSDGKLVYVGMYDTSREAYQDQRRLKTLFVDS